MDGKLEGDGPNPFKYPNLPNRAGLELGQIIKDNEERLEILQRDNQKISQPVFAAHSIHDETLKIFGTMGILDLLQNHVDNGLAFLIAHTVPHDDEVKGEEEKRPHCVRHEEVVLAHPIQVRNHEPRFEEFKDCKKPLANPKFDLMMQTAWNFFEKYLIKSS